MNNMLYEKTYRVGKQNKWNAILNFSFIALCLVYFFVLIFTTENESGELGEGLSLAIRLAGVSFVLISAAIVFLINGITSAIISSKMLKLSQGETIKKGVFTASIIIKMSQG
ncbi:MAG: hypothetical protein IJY26_04235, partial [Clostridia bacterium]|nr:hypothetical protein [Clostridia bacterium]